MKFRKKPVVIDAIRADRHRDDVIAFLGGEEERNLNFGISSDDVWINTLEGRMTYPRSYWLIKGIRGEFYACRADIFEATYEPANAAPQHSLTREEAEHLVGPHESGPPSGFLSGCPICESTNIKLRSIASGSPTEEGK